MKNRILRFLSLLSLLILAACQSAASSSEIPDLPQGDAEKGALLFAESVNGAPACSTCHNTTDEVKVGPGLARVAERAATRNEGQSAQDYIYTSITRPNVYIVEDFANLMFSRYRDLLKDQEIADLMAYLLTL